jgi:hypothetical protein
MKSLKKDDQVKLRKALAAAYNEKEKVEVGELWQARVMGHIQELVPPYSTISILEAFERFVWRLSPVTCFLVLLLSAVISQIDFILDYEIMKMFMEDPTDFSLLSSYR